MGDIADMYSDYFDHFDDDDDDPTDIVCNRCNEGGLTWIEHDTKWRLHEPNGKLHVCRQVDCADEFEDLT